ncbi:MAG: S41 family peptidase [Planctomycetota bacterium]
MIQRTLALAVPVALLLALSPLPPAAGAAPGPQESDLGALVAGEAAAAADRPAGTLWSRALDLRGAEALGAPGELDRLLEERLGRPAELSAPATLLFVAARLQGEEAPQILLANALIPLLDHPDEAVAMAAASLLADGAFRGLSRSRRELVGGLLGKARDAARPPAWRLRFASTAHAVGAGEEGRAARDLIVEFLGSSDPELRAQGALALATLRGEPIEGQLRRELEALRRVPGERGALATSLLKRAEEEEYYRSQIREQRRLQEEDQVPADLAELVAVRQMIETRHLEGGLVEQEDLMEAAIDGMLRYMDLHSSYMSSETYARFFQDLEADYGGIGAYVDMDPDDGLFTIQRPIYSGPAYRAGLLTDDKIVRIDDWPTIGQDREEIIKRLKGKPGTPVKLYVWQRGMDIDLAERPTEDMAVTLVREQIEIPAGSWQMLPGKIGLIELTTFSRVAMEELRHWIPQMQADGMRALVLDMRRNSGGLLTEAREVADLFLPKNKVVVSTEGRDEKPVPLYTRYDPILPAAMPLVILTGRFTASAAEIVSGALKDHGRATLVGQVTFGKGSVQQLLPVDGAPEDRWADDNGNYRWDSWEPITEDLDGDGEVDYAPRVKLTVARYLLPSGRSIHREVNREGEVIQEGGVEPDFVVEPGLIERWRFEERRRILRSPRLNEYLNRSYPANRELFARLAVNDEKNPDHYPDFDALMASLDTTLPRDDVRRVVRELVRRRVQDEKGAEFPYGDFVEDPQVQKAVEVALEPLGQKPADFADFALVFDFAEEPAAHRDIPTLVRSDSAELRRARALIVEAREKGDALSDESLRELLEILDGEIAAGGDE